jgi:hypothetical protein
MSVCKLFETLQAENAERGDTEEIFRDSFILLLSQLCFCPWVLALGFSGPPGQECRMCVDRLDNHPSSKHLWMAD